MHAKQRLSKLEKELGKHTGGKIANADKIQVLQWRREKEIEDKVKKRMVELLNKYPGASKEEFTFLLLRNFGTKEDHDR